MPIQMRTRTRTPRFRSSTALDWRASRQLVSRNSLNFVSSKSIRRISPMWTSRISTKNICRSHTILSAAPVSRFFERCVRTVYSQRVLDHYQKPRNVGKMDSKDQHVGTGWVGSPACGDVMKLQIRVNPTNQRIEDACFKTFGCGSAIASSSVVTEMVKNKTVDEALYIKNSVISQHLSLPPVKLHCSMLAEDAIKSAVADWKKKYYKNSQKDIARLSGNVLVLGQ